ncbi:MAG: hypothetical protein MHM6MM_005238 [Cercozoa sp. M6MM]
MLLAALATLCAVAQASTVDVTVTDLGEVADGGIAVSFTATVTQVSAVTLDFSILACHKSLYDGVPSECEEVALTAPSDIMDVNFSPGEYSLTQLVYFDDYPTRQYIFASITVDGELDPTDKTMAQPFTEYCSPYGIDHDDVCNTAPMTGEPYYMFYQLSDPNSPVLSLVAQDLDTEFRVDCGGHYTFAKGVVSVLKSSPMQQCSIVVLQNNFTINDDTRMMTPETALEPSYFIDVADADGSIELATGRIEDSSNTLKATLRMRGDTVGSRAVLVKDNTVIAFVQFEAYGTYTVTLSEEVAMAPDSLTVTVYTEYVQVPTQYTLDTTQVRDVSLASGEYCLLDKSECNLSKQDSLIDGWPIRIADVIVEGVIVENELSFHVKLSDETFLAELSPLSLNFLSSSAVDGDYGSVGGVVSVSKGYAECGFVFEETQEMFGDWDIEVFFGVCLDKECSRISGANSPTSFRYRLNMNETHDPDFLYDVGGRNMSDLHLDGLYFSPMPMDESTGVLPVHVMVTNDFNFGQVRRLQIDCTRRDDGKQFSMWRDVFFYAYERRVLEWDGIIVDDQDSSLSWHIVECTATMTRSFGGPFNVETVTASSTYYICGQDQAYDENTDTCVASPGSGYPPSFPLLIDFDAEMYMMDVWAGQVSFRLSVRHSNLFPALVQYKPTSCCITRKAPVREPFGPRLDEVALPECEIELRDGDLVYTDTGDSYAVGYDVWTPFVKGSQPAHEEVLVVQAADQTGRATGTSTTTLGLNLLTWQFGECRFEVRNQFDEVVRDIPVRWNTTTLLENKPDDTWQDRVYMDYMNYEIGTPEMMGDNLLIHDVSLYNAFAYGEFGRFLLDCEITDSVRDFEVTTQSFVGDWFPLPGRRRNYLVSGLGQTSIELAGLARTDGNCALRVQVRDIVMPQQINLKLFAYSCGKGAYFDYLIHDCTSMYVSIADLVAPLNCVNGYVSGGVCKCDYYYKNDPELAHREEGNAWCTVKADRYDGIKPTTTDKPSDFLDDIMNKSDDMDKAQVKKAKDMAAFLAIVFSVLSVAFLLGGFLLWRRYKKKKQHGGQSKGPLTDLDVEDIVEDIALHELTTESSPSNTTTASHLTEAALV